MKRLKRVHVRKLVEGVLQERLFYGLIQGDLGSIAADIGKCLAIIDRLKRDGRVSHHLMRKADDIETILRDAAEVVEDASQGMDMQAAMRVQMGEMTRGAVLLDDMYDFLRDAIETIDDLHSTVGRDPNGRALVAHLDELSELLGDALDLVSEPM